MPTHIHQTCKENRAALEASHLIRLNMAKATKPHFIGEEPIKPCLYGLAEKLTQLPKDYNMCQKTFKKNQL